MRSISPKGFEEENSSNYDTREEDKINEEEKILPRIWYNNSGPFNLTRERHKLPKETKELPHFLGDLLKIMVE